MKFELEITKIQTLSEAEALGAGLPEGASINNGAPFLYATFKDLESNEQTALRSEAFDGDSFRLQNAQRNFWENVGLILWKRFDADTYPYIEKDGMAFCKSLVKET